jgi:hypothetical protein
VNAVGLLLVEPRTASVVDYELWIGELLAIAPPPLSLQLQRASRLQLACVEKATETRRSI